MKLLIVEPEIKGHFISLYVRKVIEAQKKNVKIYLLTSVKINNSDVLKLIKKNNPSINLLYTEELAYPENKNIFSLISFQLYNFLKIKRRINYFDKKFDFKHIFFSNLDHFDKILCFFSNPFNSKNFSGILVNPRVHQFFKQNVLKYLIYKYFTFKLIKNIYLKRIMSNDILFYNFSKKIFKNKKINYFNEPVDSYLSYKNQYKINFKNNSIKILIYGSIRYSKSIEEIILLVKKLKSKINVVVTIAGVHEKDVKAVLGYKNLIKNDVVENFNILNRFIKPNEERKLFEKTDFVWCYYKNTPLGSSGVFHLSNSYKKPVITNDEGLLGWYNKKYKLGPILNFNNNTSSKNSINTIQNLFKRKSKIKQYTRNQLKLYKMIKKQSKFSVIMRNLMTS